MKFDFLRFKSLLVIGSVFFLMFLMVSCGGEEDEWSDGEEVTAGEDGQTKVSLRGGPVFDKYGYPVFYFPRHPDNDFYALDWCETYDSNCGEAVAEEFCWQKGYRGHLYVGPYGYGKYSNIGKPTRTIKNNHLCNHSGCDSFWFIRCLKDENEDFKPKYGNYRVDFCKTLGSDCGQKAADAYCEQFKTYDNDSFADRWEKANNVGPTKTFDGKTCNQSGCDSFKYIYCAKPGYAI